MMDRVSTTADSDDAQGETLAWRVDGMDCASCVAKVRIAVERLPGLTDVEVNLMAERLTLRRSLDGATPTSIERQISALGYRSSRLAGTTAAQQGQSHDHHAERGTHAGHVHAHGGADEAEDRAGIPWFRTGKARLVAVLGVLVAVASVMSSLLPREAYWIYLAATLAAVFPFGRRAVALAGAGTPFSIETLMCAAALGAVAIGAAEEAAVVVLLFAVGELLENVAAGQARAGIRALASLIPHTPRRRPRHGTE